MKTCTKCGDTKDVSLFGKDKYKKSGISPWCKECVRLSSAKRRLENPEKARTSSSKYREANREKERARYIRYNKENPSVRAANAAKRRAIQGRASPNWLSEEDTTKIKNFYEISLVMSEYIGEPHHVDHIIPLMGENVCGLHVPWNLQVLPAKENQLKGNRL